MPYETNYAEKMSLWSVLRNGKEIVRKTNESGFFNTRHLEEVDGRKCVYLPDQLNR